MAAEPTGPEPATPAAEPSPPPLLALAEKANDLEALRTALVDAAGVGFGLWVSYLGMLFYLLVAAGAVTHIDLFYENPVKLPFLSVDLPLTGFFWLGPALFLIIHAYVLLHFVMLADKVSAFDGQLRVQIKDDPELRTRLRRQLPNNIFVQFLAGPREVRNGLIGLLLWLIALISLVIGPVALLLFFQLQFLPYHDPAITWWQRIAVVIDLALLWMLWPRVGLRKDICTEEDRARRRGVVEATQRIGTRGGMLLLTLIAVPLVFAIAIIPGEWQDKRLKPFPPIALLREVLIEGKVDMASRKPKSLWSNRLVLPGLDVIDHTKLDEAKIAALPQTASLRARHLEGAVLINAGLRKVNFRGAHLEGARLDFADLRGASFQCIYPTESSDERICAQLQGAQLDRAGLQGARLDGAQLQGASLEAAELQGASLQSADLQGARLDGAQLQGARLDWARLQGASLVGTELQAASFDKAKLQGAWLFGAQLQGASLESADLQGASLSEVFVWRADITSAENMKDARIQNTETEAKQPTIGPGPETAPWTVDSFNKLKQRIEELVPEPRRTAALAQIEPRLNPARPLKGEEEMAARWTELQSSPISDADYEKKLAEIGCDTKGAPYVAAALTQRLRAVADPSRGSSAFPPALVPLLAAEFLKAECAGAHGLSDDAKGVLYGLSCNDCGSAPSSPVQ
jgi:uncharacterized protein YjbI with pentapeptide repeats